MPDISTRLVLAQDEAHVADADGEPVSIAAWFHERGGGVFPVRFVRKGPEHFDKVPAVPKGTSWKDHQSPRSAIVRWPAYGVALGHLVVVDTDSASNEAWAVAHLPPTPFMVTTGPHHDGSPGRGRHRYYKRTSDAGAGGEIRRDGLTLEFRSAGRYVVGPGSVRPDGVRYTPDDWSWDLADVPGFPTDFGFDDRTISIRRAAVGAYTMPEPGTLPASAGSWPELFKLLRSYKAAALPFEQMWPALLWTNAVCCERPHQIDDRFRTRVRKAWDQADRPFPSHDVFPDPFHRDPLADPFSRRIKSR